jgi:hypothetical protein
MSGTSQRANFIQKRVLSPEQYSYSQSQLSQRNSRRESENPYREGNPNSRKKPSLLQDAVSLVSCSRQVARPSLESNNAKSISDAQLALLYLFVEFFLKMKNPNTTKSVIICLHPKHKEEQ